MRAPCIAYSVQQLFLVPKQANIAFVSMRVVFWLIFFLDALGRRPSVFIFLFFLGVCFSSKEQGDPPAHTPALWRL
jgi:hypothetical protein